MSLNLFAIRLWFTESNALLKSIVNILTAMQVGSSSLSLIGKSKHTCFSFFLLLYQLSSNFKATGVHLCFTMFMGLFRRLKVIQAWLASHVNTMYHLYGRGT